jgi:hypothetical protein
LIEPRSAGRRVMQCDAGMSGQPRRTAFVLCAERLSAMGLIACRFGVPASNWVRNRRNSAFVSPGAVIPCTRPVARRATGHRQDSDALSACTETNRPIPITTILFQDRGQA